MYLISWTKKSTRSWSKSEELVKISWLMTVSVDDHAEKLIQQLIIDGLGYHDDGEETLGVGEDAFDGRTVFIVAHSLNCIVYTARKRLKEAARENDQKMTKKARRIAEVSSGSQGSILKHLQTGISAAPKPKPTEVASKIPDLLK